MKRTLDVFEQSIVLVDEKAVLKSMELLRR